jgi:hypothetical protein
VTTFSGQGSHLPRSFSIPISRPHRRAVGQAFAVGFFLVLSGCQSQTTSGGTAPPLEFTATGSISFNASESNGAFVIGIDSATDKQWQGEISTDRFNDTNIQLVLVDPNTEKSVSLVHGSDVAGRYLERFQDKSNGQERARCLEETAKPPCPPKITGGNRFTFRPQGNGNSRDAPVMPAGTWKLYLLYHHAPNLQVKLQIPTGLLAGRWESIRASFAAIRLDNTDAVKQDLRACGTIYCGSITGGRAFFGLPAWNLAYFEIYGLARTQANVNGCLFRNESQSRECVALEGPIAPDPLTLVDFATSTKSSLSSSAASFSGVEVSGSSLVDLRSGFNFRAVAWSIE